MYMYMCIYEYININIYMCTSIEIFSIYTYIYRCIQVYVCM